MDEPPFLFPLVNKRSTSSQKLGKISWTNGCPNCAYSLQRPFKVTYTNSSSSTCVLIEPREFARPLTCMEYSFMFNLFLYALCNSYLSYIFCAMVLVMYIFNNVSHTSFGISTSCTICTSRVSFCLLYQSSLLKYALFIINIPSLDLCLL